MRQTAVKHLSDGTVAVKIGTRYERVVNGDLFAIHSGDSKRATSQRRALHAAIIASMEAQPLVPESPPIYPSAARLALMATTAGYEFNEIPEGTLIRVLDGADLLFEELHAARETIEESSDIEERNAAAQCLLARKTEEMPVGSLRWPPMWASDLKHLLHECEAQLEASARE